MVKQGYKQTEFGIIPNDWEICSVKDLYLKARIGWQGLKKDEYLLDGDYYLVTGTDFNDDRIDWRKCHYVSPERYRQDKNIQLLVEDILITKDGSIGKTAFVDFLNKPATLNSGIFVVRPKSNNISRIYLYYVFKSEYFNRFLKDLTAGSTIIHLYQKDFITFNYPVPSKNEQKLIAKTILDIDSMILSLEKLIEKKKAIKQGAMQELLTGKKRLSGFAGEWVNKKVEDIAEVGRGRVISHIEISKNIGGKYPVYSSQTTNNGIMGHLRTFDFDGDYITWTTDGVNAGTVFYRSGKFNCTNVCGTLKCKKDNADFVARRLGIETPNYVATNLANPKLMNDVMKKITITLPPTIEEQNAIATILSDMDNEIEALGQKLAKTRQLKQGMMQQLLTGKIRLIDDENVFAGAVKHNDLTEVKTSHNHQFDDAVMIAAIVNAFYSEKYPLGRKKVQKLLYLLRRKQDVDTSEFKKKAAGPYADEVRYKGGEPIAKRNGYIATSTTSKGTSFSKGKKIDAALNYVQKWGMESDFDWLLSQFKYTSVNDLELYATIDMAICDLQNEGVEISVDTVKNLIGSNKEWKAKLKKNYFSDTDIARAIAMSKKLFS